MHQQHGNHTSADRIVSQRWAGTQNGVSQTRHNTRTLPTANHTHTSWLSNRSMSDRTRAGRPQP